MRIAGTTDPASLAATENLMTYDCHDWGFDASKWVGGVEGCLARPGTLWEWFVVMGSRRFAKETYCATESCGGTPGHVIRVPGDWDVDHDFVLARLELYVDLLEPKHVHGPDSLSLK